MSAYYTGTERIAELSKIIMNRVESFSYRKEQLTKAGGKDIESLYYLLCNLNNYSMIERYGLNAMEKVEDFPKEINNICTLEKKIDLMKEYLYQSCEGHATNEKLYKILLSVKTDLLEDFYRSKTQ